MARLGIFAVLIFFGAALCIAVGKTDAQTPASLPLQLETKIPLGDVRGRIDHMAVDLPRQRLFVAELGNDTVAIVDLKGRQVIHAIGGLSEPQGVGYMPSMETLYVANGRDGSVRVFNGANYAAVGQIDVGENADNIRVDAGTSEIFVGYGSGALAVIDANSFRKIADIPLRAHPESFQIDPTSKQIFVNLPSTREIAVVDRESLRQVARWSIDMIGGNFPMAIDQAARRVLSVFRNPAMFGVFSIKDGRLITSPEICADADDLFVDAKRNRVYVSCGDGFLDVLTNEGISYKRIGHITTVSGARTSLFVPELDRLVLAVRAASGEPAAIWVFRPTL
jgi:YVTN family beta-propeller protein